MAVAQPTAADLDFITAESVEDANAGQVSTMAAAAKKTADGENHANVNVEVDDADDADDDETELEPLSHTLPLLAIFILYSLLGALLLSCYEPDMTFFKGLYFVYISLTSIGLGGSKRFFVCKRIAA